MSKKICLINQPVGLGDIIFCQKIGYHYMDEGYEIHWPVNDIYLDDVKKYIDSPFKFYENVNDFPYGDSIFSDEFVYLKLDRNSIYNKLIMESKYIISKVDSHNDWKDFFSINRDTEKENELFDMMTSGEDYMLVNLNYGSPPNWLRMKYELENKKLKQVDMNFLIGYSIFDWCKIIENASGICITDSVGALLVEKLKPNTEDLTILSRRDDFDELKCMYDLDWNFKRGQRT